MYRYFQQVHHEEEDRSGADEDLLRQVQGEQIGGHDGARGVSHHGGKSPQESSRAVGRPVVRQGEIPGHELLDYHQEQADEDHHRQDELEGPIRHPVSHPHPGGHSRQGGGQHPPEVGEPDLLPVDDDRADISDDEEGQHRGGRGFAAEIGGVEGHHQDGHPPQPRLVQAYQKSPEGQQCDIDHGQKIGQSMRHGILFFLQTLIRIDQYTTAPRSGKSQ